MAASHPRRSDRLPDPSPSSGSSIAPEPAAGDPERSLASLRAALDATADGVLVVNTRGEIVHFNRKFAEMWGLPPEVLAPGEDVSAIEFAQEQLRDPEGFARRIRELYAEPDAESYDMIEFRDGRTFERFSQPQRVNGEIVGRVWSYRDATARRRAERVLRRRERQLRETQKLARLGSWRWSAASGTVVLSRELARICGFEAGVREIPLRGFFDHIHPDDHPQLRRAIRAAVEEGSPFELVHRVVRPDGALCILHSRGRRVGRGRGEQARLLGTGQEITDLKRAEQQAQQMADRMRAVAAAAAGVIGAKTEAELRGVLEEACRTVLSFDAFFIQAYDAEEHAFHGVGGVDAGIYSPSRVIPAAGTPGERVVRERRTLVTRRSTDPAVRGALLTGTGRRSESAIRAPILSGSEVLGIISIQSYTPDLYTEQDVEVLEAIASLAATALTNIRLAKERREAEAALRASERRFRTIFEQFPLGIQIFAPTGESLEVNQAWRDLFRTNQEAIAGYNTLKDSQLEAIGAYVRQAFAGEPATPPPVLYDARRTVGEMTGRDDAELPGPTWMQSFLCPVKDVDGSVREVFFIHQDITQQKEAEEVLRRSHDELERLVAARTLELRQAKSDAEQAREAAERANRAKSEFLSRMSHELRTPMNSILGFGQLLAKHEVSEDQRRSVNHILRAGKHLLKLIDEVLDIARIESNRQQLSIEPVNVHSVVQEAVSLIRPLAAQYDCHIADDPPEGCERYVRADYQRLTQVLLNLLSNAIKYNRTGGSVALSCEMVADAENGGDRLRIRVRDTGPGIPAEKQSELFVPFARLGAEQTEIEGTGLGLALSQRLVEAMGGRLTVESAMDEGSTFSVELPLSRSPVDDMARGRSDAKASPASLREARSATILYIEENLANFALIETILADRPEISLISALQGRLGLELACEHLPELILLDLHLPDLGGDAVLRLLRRDARTREIPVIIISADATPSRIQRLRQAGAYDYITKPLDVDSFLEAVDRVLGERPPPPSRHLPHEGRGENDTVPD